MIYIFIGQPHSGKTTLANHLKNALLFFQPKRKVHIIDGDVLRKILNNKDYSEQGRRNNIKTAFNIAKFLETELKSDVIIAMVNPFLDLREEFKENSIVLEIYVHTTNIRGRENYHVENFEKPIQNFIEIDTTDVDELTSLNELFEKIPQINFTIDIYD